MEYTMTFGELKFKANNLPMEPGVYVMRDKKNTVIYVGKAKKLKNRVSQYFVDTVSHSPKTRLMISKIDHFDIIIAATEFEALVLECSLIKRYLPKYNILLKDDKGYPYLRLDIKKQYPKITLVSKISDDGAEYFGPYGSRGVTQDLLNTIVFALKLPSCNKIFPQDIGKGRPCLNYHMNQCKGWCKELGSRDEYLESIEIARQLLQGNFKPVADQLRAQMLQASDMLNFELAATIRDRLNAITALQNKQVVTTGAKIDIDAIGFAQTASVACFTVLHFCNGNLLDKEYEILQVSDEPEAMVSSLLKQYYFNREFAPRTILLPFAMDDAELFSQLMAKKFCRKTRIYVPQRGENVRIVEMAVKNAREEAERITTKEERTSGSLRLLGKMLAIELPARIESFDISNISGTDMVASMVVFQDGKPKKSDYKRFKIKDQKEQDDYASMQQVVMRRFEHYINKDPGFEVPPDLILIDGGAVHAKMAQSVLYDMELSFPVFGMVKDDRHRTRALVTPEGNEVRIDTQQSVFSFIGSIQEETHRFAVTFHRQLRSKRLRYSELDQIPGIGPKRKQALLKHFKSLSAVKNATLYELEQLLPRDAAFAVYAHFNEKNERG